MQMLQRCLDCDMIDLKTDHPLKLCKPETLWVRRNKAKQSIVREYDFYSSKLEFLRLRLLEQSGTKLELEAVSGLRPSYMTRVYLRKKIEDSLRQQPPNWAEKDFSLSEGDEEVDGKDDLSLSADESNEDEDWSRDLIVENASVVLGEKGRNVMSGPLKSMAEQDII
uniref:Uncharacterized protein n=1 Tax=Plectus sambesii TaxID=2011161 RepID=A0A914XM04_9BILA